MVGLVIATHARLGHELLAAAEMIIGPSERVRAITVDSTRGVDAIRQELGAAVADVGTDGDGVLIMTDMFGGTPSNLGIAFLDPGKVEMVTGVNLPMVLKCLNCQEGMPLPEMATLLRAYGQQSITLASDLLNRAGRGLKTN